MHIVIDIPEKLYEYAKANLIDSVDEVSVIGAIADGTPLPKGHGRLIDADAVDTRYSDPEVVETLDKAPTIIEADKENK